eukprot:superscaffoldBa00004272_g18572
MLLTPVHVQLADFCTTRQKFMRTCGILHNMALRILSLLALPPPQYEDPVPQPLPNRKAINREQGSMRMTASVRTRPLPDTPCTPDALVLRTAGRSVATASSPGTSSPTYRSRLWKN